MQAWSAGREVTPANSGAEDLQGAFRREGSPGSTADRPSTRAKLRSAKPVGAVASASGAMSTPNERYNNVSSFQGQLLAVACLERGLSGPCLTGKQLLLQSL